MKTINFVLIATICFVRIALTGPGMSSESQKLQISQKKMHGMLISAIQQHDQNKVALILGHLKKKTVNNGDRSSLSPLHYAVVLDNHWSKYYIVKSLIDAGANPCNLDGYGCTPHELAAVYYNKVLGSNTSTDIEVSVTKAVLDALGVEKHRI